MGEACGREDGNLLTKSFGVYSVDEGDAGLYHGLGVVAGGGVDGHAVEVEVSLGQQEGGCHGKRMEIKEQKNNTI